MGQIELSAAEGKPVNRSDRFASDSGSASNVMTTIRFRWLMFVEPVDGAPALARWLADEHRCRAFRYEFNMDADYLPDVEADGED